MAESILVTGKKISTMELVTNVVGNEKIPTGQPDDLALTPNQIADHTIARGDLASQEDLSQVEVSLGTQITDLESDLASDLAAEEAARIAADNDLQAVIDSDVANLQSALDAEVSARSAADDLKVDKEGSVSSVAGRVGDVSLAPSDVLIDGFGSQEVVNRYVDKPFLSGDVYGIGDRVRLSGGDIVKSTVAGNTTDPNVDMTGWVLIGGEWVDITNLLIVSDPLASTWNSTVINNAITKAKAENKGVMCAPKGTVHAEGDLDFKFIQYIKFYSDILNSTGTVIVGGFSTTAHPVDITFQRITNGTSAMVGAIPTIDTFRCEGIKAGNVEVGQTNLLRIHAVGGDANRSSNAYFSMQLNGSVRAFRVSDEGSGGWNNRIHVKGGRLIDLDITGTGYVHNELLFDDNTFEGSLVSIRMKRAWTNRIINARFEGVSDAAGVFFDTDTMQNTIIQRWSGSGSPRSQFSFSPTVIDNGRGNQCTTQSAVEFNNVELFSVSANSGIVSNDSSSACLDSRVGRVKGSLVGKNVLQPALTGFTAQGNRFIAISDVVEVKNGDAVKFDCDFDGNLLRPYVYIFDQNMQAITDAASDDVLLVSPVFSSSSAGFLNTVDLTATAIRTGFSINSDRIKYIQVGCYSASGGFFRHISASLFTQKLLRNKAISELSASQVIPDIAGKPTAGFVSVGTKLFDTTVRELISCTDALETFITSATNSSTVNVNRNTGLKVGAIAGVIQVDGTTEWVLVNSISGNDITLSKSVNVSAGARFVANSWAYDKPINSVAYSPPSIAVDENVITTVILTGVSTGDNVSVAFSQYHPDIEIIAAVSSVDTVTVKFKNVGASTVDLASGTLTVKMI